MEVKAKSQAGVALVAKAFQILDMFQADRSTWTQAELVRATDLNRSTVNRLVRFLVSRGYLNQNSNTGRYSLGLGLIELGMRASAGFELRTVCQTAMTYLANKIHETVVLSAFDPSSCTAICVDQIEGQHEGLRVFERIGSTFPLHAGAAPRAILAFLSQDQQAECLKGELAKITENTQIDLEHITQLISETRERGYAISWEETFEGTAGLAAPILGIQDLAIGSLAVALPINRAKPDVIKSIATDLMVAASGISRELKGK